MCGVKCLLSTSLNLAFGSGAPMISARNDFALATASATLHKGSGFRVQGSGFRVQGFGSWVLGLGFWVLGFGFLDFGFLGSGFRFQGSLGIEN
jgi:hypothetical protein